MIDGMMGTWSYKIGANPIQRYRHPFGAIAILATQRKPVYVPLPVSHLHHGIAGNRCDGVLICTGQVVVLAVCTVRNFLGHA